MKEWILIMTLGVSNNITDVKSTQTIIKDGFKNYENCSKGGGEIGLTITNQIKKIKTIDNKKTRNKTTFTYRCIEIVK